MYVLNTELDQRPNAWIVESRTPVLAAAVAAPIRTVSGISRRPDSCAGQRRPNYINETGFRRGNTLNRAEESSRGRAMASRIGVDGFYGAEKVACPSNKDLDTTTILVCLGPLEEDPYHPTVLTDRHIAPG